MDAALFIYLEENNFSKKQLGVFLSCIVEHVYHSMCN